MVFWITLILACLTYYLLAILSVGIVYHRALTHRSLRLSRWFEYTMATIALASGTPVQFVGNHRFHHLHTDDEHDPHSPTTHGFWYAHVGWYIPSKNKALCILYALGGPLRMLFDAYNRPRTNLQHNYLAGDIAKTAYYRWLSKPIIYGIIVSVQAIVGLFIFYYFWGITGIICLWFTLVVIFNLGDGLNSWCHLYGHRVSNSNGKATNLLIMSWLTMGDGWHANHHVFPNSANLGLLPMQADPTYTIIRFLSFLSIAKEVKTPDKAVIAEKLKGELHHNGTFRRP